MVFVSLVVSMEIDMVLSFIAAYLDSFTRRHLYLSFYIDLLTV